MSCNNRGIRVSQAAGTAAGISSTSNQSGNTLGAMINPAKIDQAIDQVGKKISPVANAIVFATGSQEKTRAIATLLTLAAASALAIHTGTKLLKQSGEKAALHTAAKILKKGARIQTTNQALKWAPWKIQLGIPVMLAAVETASTVAGNSLAQATKTENIGPVTQPKKRLLFLESKEEIPLWKSRLTGPFNRMDVIGTINHHNIISSRGVMLKIRGVTWHRGTSLVKMPGGRRTITHLQSLRFPATHHFFSRTISDEQAASVASGTLKPESIPGYVGSISSTESLLGLWANTKRAMILARLHWPPQKGKSK